MKINRAVQEIDKIIEEGMRLNSVWSPKNYYEELKRILIILGEDNEGISSTT